MSDGTRTASDLEDIHEDLIGDYEATEDSDDEVDWEEITAAPTSDVALADATISAAASSALPAEVHNIEITLKGKKKGYKSKPKADLHVERLLRLNVHKIHTVSLLSNAIVRNRWLNDELLRARLLSLVPLSIQTSFSSITKARFPDPVKRGRLFETALMRLTEWWYDSFEVIPFGHLRSRTFDEVQKIIANGDMDELSGEIIRSPKSLMKHALLRRGCRDTSAQLFTALCRALDLPARLVVSLQSVPWQAKVGQPKPAYGSKGKGKDVAAPKDVAGSSKQTLDNEDQHDMEEVDIPGPSDAGGSNGAGSSKGKGVDRGKGKEKAKPVIKLRKSKPNYKRQAPPPPVDGWPPVFWTEVFSRPDGKWMPVDPIRYKVNKRKVFEPPPHSRDNRMVYVIAVEEDGYCRDVTPRYAKDYGAKTSKIQLGGKGRQQWWERVMACVTRPFRLNRDDVEDEEFEIKQLTEGMPTSMSGFKDHPLYVLERHLKRDEVIHPKNELGKFRGEPVYARANVVQLKTAENWMRLGRRIREGCQPMKMVKQRAVTIHRRRAVELAQQEGEEVLQGLYASSQTELFIPDPVIDGRIPKNDFGNIDLYVPSMLPAGAAHLPYKGIVKIARQLGFDHAEAVTNFEFKKGRAFPIIEGIVVAQENEEPILEAFWAAEQDAEEKERAKRQQRVLKRWAKLIHGLQIRQRLREQYGNEDRLPQDPNALPPDAPGGFITEADAIVQPFHLPEFRHGLHHTFNDPGTSNEVEDMKDKLGWDAQELAHEFSAIQSDPMEADDDEPRLGGPEQPQNGVPQTMAELAAAAAAEAQDTGNSEANTQRPLDQVIGAIANGQASRGATRRTRVPTDASPSPSGGASTPTSRKKRQRTRKQRSSSVSSNGDSDANDGDKPTPSKRGKTIVVPTSTRVLRTRKPKPTEKLREEEDAEDAFRRATAL